MRVVIDPASLDATASVLRTAAEVLAELCPQVAHAVDGVWAPPGVAGHVEAGLTGVASTIHAIVLELLEEAADLNRRSACCCQDEVTSLPVPALAGLAFGAGSALAGATQVQLGSQVSAAAASGPGLRVFTPAPSMVSAAAASGPSVVAPVLAAPAPPAAAPISIYEALGSGSFGTGSPVGSGVSMVYDPTNDPMRPSLGVGMVFDPTAPAVAHAGMSSSVPLYGSRMDTVLANIGVQPLNQQALSNVHNMQRATVPNAFMG